MISQSAQYAVRAVMHIARDRRWHTAGEVSAATGIPPGYLAKLLNVLARSDILLSQRGMNGGFQIARDPRLVAVLAVIRAVDPPPLYGSCRQCHAAAPVPECAANRLFLAVEEVAERMLQEASVAGLLAGCTPDDSRSPPAAAG